MSPFYEKETVQKIGAFWNDRAEKFKTDEERIDSTHRSQIARFRDFNEHTFRVKGTRILDVGCGTGDFFGYLSTCYYEKDFFYHGVDLSEAMVGRAKEKYPEAAHAFKADTILDWPNNGPQWDYVVAFATFSFPVENIFLEKMLEKMFVLCKKAVHVSLLSDRYKGPCEEHSKQWSPLEVLDMALEITPYVSLRHGYIPHDFSVALWR